MRETRFGENFNINSTNRLDVFRQESLPTYIKIGLEVRNQLRVCLENGWPEKPTGVKSLEDLFSLAKKVVFEKWQENAQIIIEDFLTKNQPKNKDLSQLDAAELNELINQQQLTSLGDIREANPEIWRSLIMITSEKQMATLALINHWAQEFSDQEAINMGLHGVDELKIFIKSAAILGKYIDQTYLKQIELADQPGGSSETHLSDEVGASYLYDIHTKEKNKVDVKTYSEVFPFEWPRICKRLEQLADNVENLIKQNRLPESYLGLPAYLRQMSETYGSSETNPQELNEKWRTLYQTVTELAQDGCPIMFIPQATPMVAGDANKIDTELRFGFRTKEALSLEKELDLSGIKECAQEYSDLLRGGINKKTKIPEAMVNFQPFAFGPNLTFFTTAESTEKSIISHHNVLNEIADNEMVLAENLLQKKFDREKFRKICISSTTTHELGHLILPIEEETTTKKLGSASYTNVLEELKGETTGLKILFDYYKKNKTVDLEANLVYEIGALADYLINYSINDKSEGERYHLTGVAIVNRLIEKNVLIKVDDHYETGDPEKVFEVISELAEETISFYIDPKKSRKDAKDYLEKIRKSAHSPAIRDFINCAKLK